jgi:hypothetical protein
MGAAGALGVGEALVAVIGAPVALGRAALGATADVGVGANVVAGVGEAATLGRGETEGLMLGRGVGVAAGRAANAGGCATGVSMRRSRVLA